MSSRIRRAFAALATALLAFTVVGVVAAPAQAGPVLVQCTGDETTSYSPGLTNTSASQDVDVVAHYNPCLHVDGLSVSSMTGLVERSLTADLGCTDLLATATGQRTIHWSDSRTSVFDYTRTQTFASGSLVFTYTGTITSGLYAGSAAVQTQVDLLPAGLTLCANPPGITQLAGTITLTITGV